MSTENKKLLTTEDLAHRWSMAVGTLENWRQDGTGPRYVKLGKKKIVYRLSAIVEYERTNEVNK